VPAGEECTNPLCHRVFSVFGPSYTHAQLNAATHDALLNWFGTVYAQPLAQLSMMMRTGYAVAATGKNPDHYREHVGNLAGIPLTFLAGSKNLIFLPESTALMMEWLRINNPGGNYSRVVFPDYAHMEHFIGRKAYTDVFPSILAGLKKTSSTT
jgi:cholesterol oxidase